MNMSKNQKLAFFCMRRDEEGDLFIGPKGEVCWKGGTSMQAFCWVMIDTDGNYSATFLNSDGVVDEVFSSGGYDLTDCVMSWVQTQSMRMAFVGEDILADVGKTEDDVDPLLIQEQGRITMNMAKLVSARYGDYKEVQRADAYTERLDDRRRVHQRALQSQETSN